MNAPANLSSLQAAIAEEQRIPLAWAGSTSHMNYLNFGDALSPVMVSLCTGLPTRRVPFRSLQPRLAAVGTIGHGFEAGAVWFWGTGCSNYRNPSARAEERVRYAPPPDTSMVLKATRGPVSAGLLGGGRVRDIPFGDPVWLLPRFYPATVEKRFDLGVILHLSDLADRALEAHPQPHYRRYEIAPADRSAVRLINTVTDVSAQSLRAKLDDILACKRILSTSLHGMVIAESYGIPCLYFPPNGTPGLSRVHLRPDGETDLRIVDLYLGLGVATLPVFAQERAAPTDWQEAIAAIDRAWEPRTLNTESLLAALPVAAQPIVAPAGATVFEHELIAGTEFRHDVSALLRDDRARTRGAPRAKAPPPITPAPARPAPAPRNPAASRLQRVAEHLGAVPLSWVAPTAEHPFPNLGDALSAVMVAALAGQPVRLRNFDDRRERLAAVGTIGHAMRGGRVHLWGTGFDAARFAGTPAETEFFVHAIRGPHSAALLRAHGVSVPDHYGDPVWLLPRLLPRGKAPPRFELGVIVHISELHEATLDSRVKSGFVRYRVPASLGRSIRVINTYTARSLTGLIAKIDEILDCRRIASTSFHGILIGDAYGIPSIWFGTSGQGADRQDARAADSALDHRVRDFYAACRNSTRAVFRAERGRETDWDALMAWIDEAWTPPEFDPGPMLQSFPFPPAVDPTAPVWNIPMRALPGMVP